MKKMRNIMLCAVFVVGLISISIGLLFNYFSSPVSNSDTIKEVTITTGMSNEKIGTLLYKNNLIKSEMFFKVFLKLNKYSNLKAGTYKLSESMSLDNIVEKLVDGNDFSENEITMTFREGINMRKIAQLIASNTDNTYDDVMKVINDQEYLQEVIEKYWFVTDDILNKDIYYSLEGYLFPDTYRFNNKSVTVKEIFNKLLKQMDTVLSVYKEEINNNKYSVHQLLTLASICELEVNNDNDRSKVVGVFVNRLNKKMSLGSDITTRYSIKLDDTRALTKAEYATVNAYNTRSSTMAGKLPAGPIGMVSKSSILASINPDQNNYLYFISNIKTNETFFFANSSQFEKKKDELSQVNQGY